jgi:hypothetical protein
MRKIIIGLNVSIAIYFFLLANFLFWSSALGWLGGFSDPTIWENPWRFIVNIIFTPFLLYAIIIFFRETESKYTYGLGILLLVLLEGQIYRFFFATNHMLEVTDLKNLIFFSVPILVIYLTKYLNTRHKDKTKKLTNTYSG